jgi:hypothetical protein
MKKMFVFLMIAGTLSIAATAQEKVEKKEVKIKKTSSPGQKVHNTFSKHKHYDGVKVKESKEVEKTK